MLPIPLGSNRPWSIAASVIVVWLLLAGAGLVRFAAPPADGARKSRLRFLVLALLVSFAGITAWQLWGPGGYTEDKFESELYLLRTLGCVAAFALVLMLVTTDRRRMVVLGGVLGAGVLQAMMAMVLFSLKGKYQLLGNDFIQGLRANGTFPGPDALANYLLLTLSAGLAVMLAQMGTGRRQDGKPWQARIRGGFEFLMSGKMLVRILLIMMVIALVLTRSRMGNGAFFLGLLLVAGWVMARSQQLRRPAAILVVSLLVVDMVIIGQWVGLSKVIDRVKATELTMQAEEAASAASDAAASDLQLVKPPPVNKQESLHERMRPARDALAMIRERPLAGFGGGSFYTAFPRYKVESLTLPYNHAHNDYVEIAADTGLPGLAVLAMVMLLSLGRVIGLMNDTRSAHVRGVAAGLGLGLICVLLHALVDLNLQINANALTLTVLLAVVWSVPLRRSVQSQRSSK